MLPFVIILIIEIVNLFKIQWIHSNKFIAMINETLQNPKFSNMDIIYSYFFKF